MVNILNTKKQWHKCQIEARLSCLGLGLRFTNPMIGFYVVQSQRVTWSFAMKGFILN